MTSKTIKFKPQANLLIFFLFFLNLAQAATQNWWQKTANNVKRKIFILLTKQKRRCKHTFVQSKWKMEQLKLDFRFFPRNQSISRFIQSVLSEWIDNKSQPHMCIACGEQSANNLSIGKLLRFSSKDFTCMH